jgi:uncharacterized OsmC-like protein
MKLIVAGEHALELRLEGGAALEIETADPHLDFSPLHMLAGSLATCSVAVLASWSAQAGLDLDGLAIDVAWEYVDDPYRVGRYDMTVHWPGLPEDRKEAAYRVIEQCTVEQTLLNPPEIETEIRAAAAS